jgi:hypothetical protein
MENLTGDVHRLTQTAQAQGQGGLAGGHNL